MSILVQKTLLAHTPLSTDPEWCDQYSQSRLFSSPGARQKGIPRVHLSLFVKRCWLPPRCGYGKAFLFKKENK